MKHLTTAVLAALALALAACGSGNNGSKSSQASGQEQSDTTMNAEENNETATRIIEVEIPAGQTEEDYAAALVENDVPQFVEDFKKSTEAADVELKEKGATLSVSFVNKATGEEIAQFDITPDDLK